MNIINGVSSANALDNDSPLTTLTAGGDLLIPVTRNTEELYVIARMDVGELFEGDKLAVFARAMVTNDDLRARGRGVASITQVRLVSEPTAGNFVMNGDKQGIAIVKALGGDNVSVEGHHLKESEAEAIEIDDHWPTAYVEYYVNAKATAREEGDVLIVDSKTVGLWGLLERGQ